MRPFRAEAQGYVAELEPSERIVLAQLAGDVAQMLQEGVPGQAPGEPGPSRPDDAWSPPGWTGPVPGGHGTDATPPPDPAVRRLLPDASDDVEVAAEFRRFTQDDLAARKVGRLVLLARMLDLVRGMGVQTVLRQDPGYFTDMIEAWKTLLPQIVAGGAGDAMFSGPRFRLREG